MCGKNTNNVECKKNQKIVDQIYALKKDYPDNITVQVFCKKYYESLKPEL